MDSTNTTGGNGEAVATSVGLAGGDLYGRIMALQPLLPTHTKAMRFAYREGFLDAKHSAAALAKKATAQWTDKPAGPGCYWVKNWSSALERMNYRVVEIFEIPPGGWTRNGRYLGSGLYVHEHGRDWPERLDCSFGSNGEPWDQLGFMALPEPTDEPANNPVQRREDNL